MVYINLIFRPQNPQISIDSETWLPTSKIKAAIKEIPFFTKLWINMNKLKNKPKTHSQTHSQTYLNVYHQRLLKITLKSDRNWLKCHNSNANSMRAMNNYAKTVRIVGIQLKTLINQLTKFNNLDRHVPLTSTKTW